MNYCQQMSSQVLLGSRLSLVHCAYFKPTGDVRFLLGHTHCHLSISRRMSNKYWLHQQHFLHHHLAVFFFPGVFWGRSEPVIFTSCILSFPKQWHKLFYFKSSQSSPLHRLKSKFCADLQGQNESPFHHTGLTKSLIPLRSAATLGPSYWRPFNFFSSLSGVTLFHISIQVSYIF